MLSRASVAIVAAVFTVVFGSFPAYPRESGPVDLGIDSAALPVEIEDFSGVRGGLFRDGRVLVGGQPDRDALRRLRELGVTVVVNLRTPSEMNDRDRVPFDEAAFVQELGLEYVHIPLGGDDHPYTPEAVAVFASVLERHSGPVFLHCTVAWRASYLWAAYLILYHDFDLPAALERGEAIAIKPPPLQGLLDRPLTLVYE
jgi:uncharacterized protein (TIGR01244 family)